MEIENVTYADVGSYQCLAVNSEGWASTTALLKVKGIDTDKTDDTLTVHRMTFDQSGSRKDSNKRPLVLVNLDKTESLDDFLSMDQINRSLSPNGIRQISMKAVSTGSATVEGGMRKISFLGSEPNEIDISDDNITPNQNMFETGLPSQCLDEKGIDDSGKAQNVDLAETDSGNFSSSSSIKQQNENKGGKITISIDEVSDDEDLHAGLEDTVEELASFLKADDEFNRTRRLTGDSGIADDDYSPTSSDEDVDHMGDKKRATRKHSEQHNKKRAKKSPSCDDLVDDQFIKSENHINNEKLESTTNISNDKVSPCGINVDPFDNKTSSSTSKMEDQNSVSEVDKPSYNIDKIGYPDNDGKTETDDKPICGNESEVESFVQNTKTRLINDRLKNGITSHQPKQKPNTIEEKNTQFDAQNINSEDDGEDIFHSDEEEHKILAEIRPNLHLKKQLFDETTSNTFSAESWSVYDSGHDCTLSESNFDAFSYQNVDIVDDSKSTSNDVRNSIGKDNMCDTAGQNDISHIDRTDNKTEQNLSCDGKINDERNEKLDHCQETDCSNIENTTTVEKAFNKSEDITFVKSAENKGKDNVDFANDNVSNDGEHVFHSDDEEHRILAEIRPNLHLKKPLLDETRSNTLSLKSAESWSMYESFDDYSLSETNLDALSYQNIDDENFFLCKFEEKSSKIGDLTTDNRIEDIQNGKESGLNQENKIKDEDSRQSHKTTEKESDGKSKISENILGFKIESQADTDKIKMDSNQLNCDIGDEILDTETRQDNPTGVSTSNNDVKEKLKTDIDTEESICIENKGNKLLTDNDDDESLLTKDKTSWILNNSEIDKSAYSNDKVPNLVTDNCVEKFLDTDETGGIVADIDFDITESPTKKTTRGLLTDSDTSLKGEGNSDDIGGLVADFDINESSHKDPTIDLNIEESIKDQIGELVYDTDIDKSNKEKGIGISTDFYIDQSPTKDEIGELASDNDIDEFPNKDKNIGILSDFDIDQSLIKEVIGELVSDIDIDEFPYKDKASGILSDIETNTLSIKDTIDCLVADIDVNESPNKDRAGEQLVDVNIDKSLSIKDNRMQLLADNDISVSLDTKGKMDESLSEKDIDNQYQGSDILKQNGPPIDRNKDNKTEQLFALGDDQTHVEESNKIIQDYNEKFRSLGKHENDRSSKHEKNENDESDLLTVHLRDTPYSSDEYIDDESDVSVEEIEEERCDILKQLDLSAYVINDASRKKQLPVLEENTSPELSDDNDCKNGVSDSIINNTIKDEEIFSLSSTGNSKADENIEKFNIHKKRNDNKVNKSINKNSMNDNQKSNDEMNIYDTSVNEELDLACDEFEKRHGIKTLQQLHSIPAYDEVNDESIGLESLSDTRPALPNTLFIGDNQSLASLMGRIAAETNTQQNASPPELEDIDFNDFVNILAVVPGKEARILLSPISEEGTVSQIAESVNSLSPESVEEHTVKKPKRPSLIDLTVTDTDGVVERINLQNIDVLQSFSKLRNYDQPIETGTEQIPRIVKGPSSITAIDGEEIILQWTITGFPEPEVVIFKDGETLDICDGITLENDKNTWTLQIPYGMKEDAGLYEICAVNSSGNDILKTRVYVKNAKNSPVREDEFNNDQREEQTGVPEFLKTPSNVEVIEGDIIHVECQITGDPSPQIVWFKNGELFYPEERVEILQDSTRCQLIIQQTEPDDAGIYMCRASNSVGVNQVQFTVCVTDQG
ncbi:uncharacterized protein MAL13P1.304-like [Mytilus californianus]|uniref:uncharacterized protein MAL13P1.304-like n=1 Tax=Mytilus californianus TaxID=6549 RepID=UPI0022486268|nr:uncharacterized protein MAL13P1.304-like [Mytilus californianus]